MDIKKITYFNLPDDNNHSLVIYRSLEIQRDENEALKMALQRTLRAKEEDLKLYNDIMEETKNVFLQGLKQYKQKADN